MKKLTFTVCVSSLLFAGSTLACEYPESPTVPNGSTASKEDMVAGQKDVKSYIKTLEDYQKCIVAEEEAARAEMGELAPEDIKQREDLLTKKYNAAHEEMVKVAAAFNEELKEYQSRGDEE